MVNAWTYLCRTTDQWPIHPADPRNLDIPKQKSFSYLTKSCNITFEQSFIQANCRFYMIIGYDYIFCSFLQTVRVGLKIGHFLVDVINGWP